MLRQADARALDAFLAALPQTVRRLKDSAGMHGYLDLVDELAGAAPRDISPAPAGSSAARTNRSSSR